jgi:hypothetical protein
MRLIRRQELEYVAPMTLGSGTGRRRFLRAVGIFVVGCLLAPRPSLSAECEVLPEKVEHFIKQLAAQVRGEEYCRFRQIARGKLTPKSDGDIVIAFNVEGACNDDKTSSPGTCGNHVEGYLKVFFGSELRDGPLLPLGSVGARTIVGMSIAPGEIVANTLVHGELDSRLIPSAHAQSRFILRGDRIVETD